MTKNKNLAVYRSTANFDEVYSEHAVFLNTELLHSIMCLLFNDILKLYHHNDPKFTIESYNKLIIKIENWRKINKNIHRVLKAYEKYGVLVKIEPKTYEVIGWNGHKNGKNNDTLVIDVKKLDMYYYTNNYDGNS